MEGRLIGFPSCVFFDGNKNRRWRPKDLQMQEGACHGYKKAHVWWIHQKRNHRQSCGVRQNTFRSIQTFTKGDISTFSEHTTGWHTWGLLETDYVFPYKRNESTSWLYRSMHNQEIRSQRNFNEWGIGFSSNRFRLFLVRWPCEHERFTIAYQTAAVVSNWQLNGRGYASQTRERYHEKLERSHNCSD